MGGVPENIAYFQIFPKLMMSRDDPYAIIKDDFVMGSSIECQNTRN